MSQRFPLVRIVRNDYWASLAVLAPVVVWGMAIILPLFGQAGGSDFAYMAGVATLVAAPVFLWRVRVIRGTLADGVDVAGVISSAAFLRGRGHISYVYSYLGERYQCSNAVQQNQQTNALVAGSKVTVALDPNNPKRAFVRELYD